MKKQSIVLVAVTVFSLIIIILIIVFSNREYKPIKDTAVTPSEDSIDATVPHTYGTISPAQATDSLIISSQSQVPNSDIQPPMQAADSMSSEGISETSIPNFFNEEVQLSEDVVLVNELPDGKNGLFFLQQTRNEVVIILEEYGIHYFMTESTNDGKTHGDYVIDYTLTHAYFTMFFDQKSLMLYRVDIAGNTGTKITTTQKGFSVGSTFDDMVKLYGSNYVIIQTDDERYPIFEYEIGDYYFHVKFMSNDYSQWGISTESIALDY